MSQSKSQELNLAGGVSNRTNWFPKKKFTA